MFSFGSNKGNAGRKNERKKEYFWWGESYFHIGKDWQNPVLSGSEKNGLFLYKELGASFDSACWEGSRSLQIQILSVHTTLFVVMEFV